MKRFVLALTAVSLLSGCSLLGRGRHPTTPTVGTRIPVLATNADVEGIVRVVKAVYDEYGFTWDAEEYHADLYDPNQLHQVHDGLPQPIAIAYDCPRSGGADSFAIPDKSVAVLVNAAAAFEERHRRAGG